MPLITMTLRTFVLSICVPFVVVILSVIMSSVTVLSVIQLSVTLLSVIQLSVTLLSVILMSVILGVSFF
jgi:hypothetical protein